MKRAIAVAVLRVTVGLMLMALPVTAQLRPVSTFSIVARDSATGQIGVAVQSHWFAVGQIVPWAEAGVGAVATQSFVDPSYGTLGLDLLRAGKSAPEALKALLNGDAACQVRQVGMIDAKGNVATFTGSRDIIAAGGIAGNQSASTQVNCGTSGGTLLVAPPWLLVPLVLPAGGLALTEILPSDILLCGFELDLQALELDPGASHGISFTAGLKLLLGG